jgi:DNA-binding transcriptional ArsR family regulator
MPEDLTTDLSGLPGRAAEASGFLRLLANEKRLLLLCHLLERGEMDVTSLAEAVALSPSALSQHLGRLRADGLVGFRRDGQTLYYRVADPRAVRLLAALKDLFCPPAAPPPVP